MHSMVKHAHAHVRKPNDFVRTIVGPTAAISESHEATSSVTSPKLVMQMLSITSDDAKHEEQRSSRRQGEVIFSGWVNARIAPQQQRVRSNFNKLGPVGSCRRPSGFKGP